MSKEGFVVECNVCGMRYDNWAGSTPCCGSIAYIVEDGEKVDKIVLFTQNEDETLKQTIFKLTEDE